MEAEENEHELSLFEDLWIGPTNLLFEKTDKRTLYKDKLVTCFANL